MPARRRKRSPSSASRQATKAPKHSFCDSCRSRKTKCTTTTYRAPCASCCERKVECTYNGDTAAGRTPGGARTNLRQIVCNPCASSKYKCDLTRPACGSCIKSGKSSVCVYPDGPREGGVTQNPGQTFGADQRSELAEYHVRFNEFGDQSLGTDQLRYRPLIFLPKALLRMQEHWSGIGDRELPVPRMIQMI